MTNTNRVENAIIETTPVDTNTAVDTNTDIKERATVDTNTVDTKVDSKVNKIKKKNKKADLELVSALETLMEGGGELFTPLPTPIGPKGPTLIKEKSDKLLSGDALYDAYYSLLDWSGLKSSLNRYSKTLEYSASELALEYTSNCKINSEHFVNAVTDVMERGINKIKEFGAIPYKYMPMGASPRILPKSYKNSINNVKKNLRSKIYQDLSTYLKTHENRVIIDLDIKSCYFSILLGLYPKDLSIIQNAMETNGIWEFIKEDFEKEGRGDLYDKSLAKVCVYSSLFQGGMNAMKNGVLEHIRKELGISTKEFRNSDQYEDYKEQAYKYAYYMNNTVFIQSFRAFSNTVLESNLNRLLVGPTGHEYLVTRDQFRNVFPSYLQSYEFYLLANTAIILKNSLDFELIGHYHDGLVVAVERPDVERFFSLFNSVDAEVQPHSISWDEFCYRH